MVFSYDHLYITIRQIIQIITPSIRISTLLCSLVSGFPWLLSRIIHGLPFPIPFLSMHSSFSYIFYGMLFGKKYLTWINILVSIFMKKPLLMQKFLCCHHDFILWYFRQSWTIITSHNGTCGNHCLYSEQTYSLQLIGCFWYWRNHCSSHLWGFLWNHCQPNFE